MDTQTKEQKTDKADRTRMAPAELHGAERGGAADAAAPPRGTGQYYRGSHRVYGRA